MEIKTKFSAGDKVWTVAYCKAIHATILRICIDKDGLSYDVETDNGEKIYYCDEKFLFASKEQLLTYVAS